MVEFRVTDKDIDFVSRLLRSGINEADLENYTKTNLFKLPKSVQVIKAWRKDFSLPEDSSRSNETDLRASKLLTKLHTMLRFTSLPHMGNLMAVAAPMLPSPQGGKGQEQSSFSAYMRRDQRGSYSNEKTTYKCNEVLSPMGEIGLDNNLVLQHNNNLFQSGSSTNFFLT